MYKKRTNYDFSKHKIHFYSDKYTKTWIFQYKDSNCGKVIFINSFGVLSVTGDFGNWIFCREFYPHADTFVSDGYWCEKLQMGSVQNAMSFNSDTAYREVQELIEESQQEKEDGEWEDSEQYNSWISYLETCKNSTDNEFEFNTALSDYPHFCDGESLPNGKKMKNRLEIIFDAFDEICLTKKVEKYGTAILKKSKKYPKCFKGKVPKKVKTKKIIKKKYSEQLEFIFYKNEVFEVYVDSDGYILYKMDDNNKTKFSLDEIEVVEWHED